MARHGRILRERLGHVAVPMCECRGFCLASMTRVQSKVASHKYSQAVDPQQLLDIVKIHLTASQ